MSRQPDERAQDPIGPGRGAHVVVEPAVLAGHRARRAEGRADALAARVALLEAELAGTGRPAGAELSSALRRAQQRALAAEQAGLEAGAAATAPVRAAAAALRAARALIADASRQAERLLDELELLRRDVLESEQDRAVDRLRLARAPAAQALRRGLEAEQALLAVALAPAGSVSPAARATSPPAALAALLATERMLMSRAAAPLARPQAPDVPVAEASAALARGSSGSPSGTATDPERLDAALARLRSERPLAGDATVAPAPAVARPLPAVTARPIPAVARPVPAVTARPIPAVARPVPAVTARPIPAVARPVPTAAARPMPAVAPPGPAARSVPLPAINRPPRSRLPGALRRLARRDPAAAGRVLAALVALQHRAGRPVSYELAVSELGRVLVIARGDATLVRPAAAGAAEVDLRIETDAAGLARLALARPGARLLARRHARLYGRRRALRALRGLARAPLSFADLAGAGVALELAVVLPWLALAVDPRWTRGHRFTIAFHDSAAAPAAPAARPWHMRAQDGRPLACFTEPPRDSPAAVLTCAPARLPALLAGVPAPAGAPAEVQGDAGAVALLAAWAQGLRAPQRQPVRAVRMVSPAAPDPESRR